MKHTLSDLKDKLRRQPASTIQRERERGRAKRTAQTRTQRETFGDFFVRENRNTNIKAERPSKHTSFSVSEGFQCETENIYLAKLQKSAVWKLDVRLLPVMALFYFLSECSRLNMGPARASGLQENLGTNDYQLSLSLTLALIPVILVEIPSNFVLRRIGARSFFPCIVILAGFLIFCHGFISNYQGLLAVRFLLGLVIGGLFPGFLLYLSTVYTRTELQWRIGLFYSAGCLSGAFSGSCIYIINLLDRSLGLAGWAWLFIIEGILTSLCGILGFYFLPSSSKDANFLTIDEKQALSQRLHAESLPLAAEILLETKPFKSSGFQICQALSSPHVILCCLTFLFCGTNVYSLTYFQSSIINSLGFGPTTSPLLTIPPYLLAFFVVLLSSYLSDKYHSRATTAVVCGGVSAIGFSVLYVSEDGKSKYGALFLIVAGAYGIIPSLAAWMSNNSEPYARKATTLALGPIWANIGGLLSNLLFTYAGSSNYIIPVVINIVFAILSVITCLANLAYLTYVESMKTYERDQLLQQYAIDDPSVDLDVQELLYLNSWEYLGDRHPDFRYLS